MGFRFGIRHATIRVSLQRSSNGQLPKWGVYCTIPTLDDLRKQGPTPIKELGTKPPPLPQLLNNQLLGPSDAPAPSLGLPELSTFLFR